MLDNQNNQLLTVKDLQAYIGVSRNTAYRLVQDGVIPSHRVSERKTLIWRSDVDAWINSH